MLLTLLLLAAFAGFGVAELALHRKRLRAIPVRVHVNGTRGKSSVTRLIAAGLRGGGMRVIAKVTGTRPRYITGDQEEQPVRRLGKANIAEQMRIARRAEAGRAQALVVENMSLDPQYQLIENRMLVRPTHCVVTNVRADHLDVMGPTVLDVGRAFGRALPKQGMLFTAEPEHLGTLTEGRPGLKVVQASPDAVSDQEMQGFGYVEHKENVALALEVCRSLGVDRQAALAGMKRSRADSGVLRVHSLSHDGKRIEFVNALAANDPDSIGMIWSLVKGRSERRMVLVNCRSDRQERSRQMADLVRGFEADWYVATGGLTRVFVRRARELGFEPSKLVDLGENRPPVEVVGRVFGLACDGCLVFACGNTVGYGEELVSRFAESRERGADIGGAVDD